jgi:hypothetical protein
MMLPDLLATTASCYTAQHPGVSLVI